MKKIIAMLLCLIWLCGCSAAPAGTEPEPTAAPEVTAAPEKETAAESAPVTFSTTDLEGNTWTEADLTGTVVMINFWEYWCGPCVSEMPALQQLQEDYADQGLQILGVFSDDSDLASVEAVLETTGVTYPILRYCADFAPFQTGYVPTTIFLDAEGRLLTGAVGAYSYDQWAEILGELM